MAKKKRQTRKKPIKTDDQQSAFWQLTGGVILLVIAFLLLLGGFGTGGPLPKTLFHGAYWTFGWAAYLLVPACGLWGVLKFTSEDRKIPLNKLISMLAALVFASGWFYAGF